MSAWECTNVLSIILTFAQADMVSKLQRIGKGGTSVRKPKWWRKLEYHFINYSLTICSLIVSLKSSGATTLLSHMGVMPLTYCYQVENFVVKLCVVNLIVQDL